MMEVKFDFKTERSVELMKAFARQMKALEEHEEELNRKKEEYVGMYERSVDDRVELKKRVHELESENMALCEKLGGDAE